MEKSRVYNGMVLLILGAIFIFHLPAINEFPKYIHAWAQSDYYALAIGFYNNGHNFFLPEGMIYNHQFPGDWLVPNPTTITAVDFPIIPWIVSFLMRMFGTTDPWVFKLVTLLYSLGSIYLFARGLKLMRLSSAKSLITISFLCLSPTFLYYQSGFMPTVSALSSAFVAFYFFARWHNGRAGKYFVWMIIFLVLAALIRKTIFILLFASLILFVYTYWQRRKEYRTIYTSYILGFSLFIVYWLYNGYLERTYGSLFLGSIIPAGDWAEFILILKESFQNWAYSFFSTSQILLGSLSIVVGLFIFVRQKSKLSLHKRELLFIVLIYLGSMLFVVLMAKQFVAHNYYLLDTFFIPNILLIGWSLHIIPETKNSSILLNIAIIPVFIVFGYQTVNHYQSMRSVNSGDRSLSGDYYAGASNLLDSLGVGRNDKILVLDNVVQHAPFILMERKGYSVNRIDSMRIAEALKWDYDYLIYEHQHFLTGVYHWYPQIISRVDIVGSNEYLTVARKRVKQGDRSLEDYLASDGKHSVQVYRNGGTSSEVKWHNLLQVEEAYHIGPSVEFGPGCSTDGIKQGMKSVQFSAKVKLSSERDFVVVFAFEHNGQTSHYLGYSSKEMNLKPGEWSGFEINLDVPTTVQDDLLRVYFYNPNKSDFSCKELVLSLLTEK